MNYEVIPRTALEAFEMMPEGTHCELIDNAIYMSPAPTWTHQNMVKHLLIKIDNFIQLQDTGGIVLSDCDIYIDEENVFRPDVFFIEKSNMNILCDDGKIRGVPTIIIEILSKSTHNIDRTKKKEKYLKAGVKEYWLIDLKTKKCTGLTQEKFLGEFEGEIAFSNLDFVVKI
jgi:Uma2 family endonuclease